MACCAERDQSVRRGQRRGAGLLPRAGYTSAAGAVGSGAGAGRGAHVAGSLHHHLFLMIRYGS